MWSEQRTAAPQPHLQSSYRYLNSPPGSTHLSLPPVLFCCPVTRVQHQPVLPSTSASTLRSLTHSLTRPSYRHSIDIHQLDTSTLGPRGCVSISNTLLARQSLRLGRRPLPLTPVAPAPACPLPCTTLSQTSRRQLQVPCHIRHRTSIRGGRHHSLPSRIHLRRPLSLLRLGLGCSKEDRSYEGAEAWLICHHPLLSLSLSST